MYGKLKYKSAEMENASTENASRAYNANLQSDKKKFGTSQISVVHLQVGVGKWTTDCFFSEIT